MFDFSFLLSIESATSPGLSARRSNPPAAITALVRAVLLSAAFSVAGCREPDSPTFRLNLDGYQPDEVSQTQREAIGGTMEEYFGTPDNPRAPAAIGLDAELIEMAAGPVEGRADGSQRGLYRQHCAVCHGISGDGGGALATTFDPYPRDFRLGVFKYTTTRAGAKPLRSDLLRTLLRGNPSTGMPSFAELSARELDALVEYVVYLSIRGETERYLVERVVKEGEYLPLGADVKEEVFEEAALWAAESWAAPQRNPQDYVIVPPPRPQYAPEQLAASIERGKELYASKNTQCAQCHGPGGAGDGENNPIYDDWNKPKIGVTPEETARLARLYRLPAQRLRPRNFLEGSFRGGGNPEDLYLRVYVGIKGTPMPAAGPQTGSSGVLTPDEIWDVVNYVLSLSGRY